MAKRIDARQLAREKLAFRYSMALERGDFAAVEEILREAARDPILEHMIREMNTVYEAELFPAAVVHSNNHHQREDESMTTIYAAPRLGRPEQKRGLPFAALAAVVAVALFAALLIGRGPGGDDEAAIPGALLQNETPTPPPFPEPSATPLPVSAIPVTVTPPPAGTALQLCEGVISGAGANVFYTPDTNGIFFTRLGSGTRIVINTQTTTLDTSSGGMAMWYEVAVIDEENRGAIGWVRADVVTVSPDCAMPVVNLMPAAGVNPCIATGIPFFAPTFTPTAAMEAIDPLFLTATAVIVEVTASAEAQAVTALQPTVVPPANELQPTIVPPANEFQPTVVPPTNCPELVPVTATPASQFDMLIGGGFDLMTTEPIGNIPPGTRVRIMSAYFNGDVYIYSIIAKDGLTTAEAQEYQLEVVPGVVPGAPTPTARFMDAWDTFVIVTRQQVGEIPAGTLVRIGSAWWNGIEWQYDVTDEQGRFAGNVLESQLEFASGGQPFGTVTPSPTPTPLPTLTSTPAS